MPPGATIGAVNVKLGLELMPQCSSQFIQVVRERTGVDDLARGRFADTCDPDGNQLALQQIVRAS